MKYTDINRKFTDTVSSYLANGYHFNTATMNGSQGEISAVDLTNDSEIIRVLLRRFNGTSSAANGLELIVGRVEAKIQPNLPTTFQTVWNDRLEVLSTECFYDLSGINGSSFYGCENEFIAAQEKRHARRALHRIHSKDITEKAAPLVKEYIREKFGVRRVIMGDIKVTKNCGKYTVKYRQHSAQLH